MANLAITARVVDKTKPGLKSATENVGKLESRTQKVGKAAKFAALGVAGIAVAGIAIGAKLVGDLLTTADAIGKMSTSLGIGVEDLQKLDFALQQGGTSIDVFEKGIQTFNKGLLDAVRKGTGPVADGLDEIGLALVDIKDLDPEEQFRLITNAISRVEEPSVRAAVAQKLFGGAGKELLPTLAAGRDALDELTAEAERNGNIMSTETVRGAEEVNDAMNSAKQALAGLATGGFAKVLPFVRTLVFWFKDKVVPTIKRDVVPIIKAFAKILGETLAPIIKDTIIPGVKRLAALFGDGGEGQGEGLRKVIKILQKVFEVALPIIAAVLETSFKIIFGLIELLIKTISGIAEFLTAVFTGDWTAAWQAILKIIVSFGEFFGKIFKAAFDLVGKLFSMFGVNLGSIAKGIANNVVNALLAIPRGLISALNIAIGAINKIVSKWNSIKFRIPVITLPSIKLGGGSFLGKSIPSVTVGGGSIGGQTISVPRIPRLPRQSFQTGGIVTRPTLAEIGESGPEAIIPLSRLGEFGGKGGGVVNLRIALNLDGERLGDFVVNRINLANNNGELDLVGT